MSELDGLRIAEYTPELAEDALRIRNAIFPPVSLEEWLGATTMRGSVAYLGDEVVGFIPMDQREFLVAPGKPIAVIFENAVGTREDVRSKGIGTAMIAAAREFLADRIDVMMVYRGAERSPGYRFYVKSGHYDMIYVRHTAWGEPRGCSQGVTVGGIDEIDADREGIHAAFSATYGEIAGFPQRSVGYQSTQLRHHIYSVLPQSKLLFRYPAQGELEAYCIVGARTAKGADPSLAILEMASRTDPEAMRPVLDAVGAEAASRQVTVTRHTSHDDPFRLLTREMGFVEGPRQFVIMGQVVRPQALCEKTCADLSLLADLKINVWTPTVDCVLYEGPQARREITIEAKDTELTRLLCRRLDVRWAIERDVISVRDGTPDIAERLGDAFAFSPWVYHHLDYI